MSATASSALSSLLVVPSGSLIAVAHSYTHAHTPRYSYMCVLDLNKSVRSPWELVEGAWDSKRANWQLIWVKKCRSLLSSSISSILLFSYVYLRKANNQIFSESRCCRHKVQTIQKAAADYCKQSVQNTQSKKRAITKAEMQTDDGRKYL